MRRSTFPVLSRLARLAFVAVAAAATAGCVSARTEGGALQMRLSRFADEAEVDAVKERTDGIEAAIVKVREDFTAADERVRTDYAAADAKLRDDLLEQQRVTQAAFDRAIAEGKSAAEAVRIGAAEGVRQAVELAATAKETAQGASTAAGAASDEARRLAAKEAADRKAAVEAMINETRSGKTNWYEIAGWALGLGGAAGVAGVRTLRGSPLRSGSRAGPAATSAPKPPAAAA